MPVTGYHQQATLAGSNVVYQRAVSAVDSEGTFAGVAYKV